MGNCAHTPITQETSDEACRCQWSETVFARRGQWGPGLELTHCQGSSATRSSVKTILLLQPVFGRHRDQVRNTSEKMKCGDWFWCNYDTTTPAHTETVTVSDKSVTSDQCWAQDRSSPTLAHGHVMVRPGPGTGAHLTWHDDTRVLLQPGLLWLRSFFFNQSSFFGRHHDQEI